MISKTIKNFNKWNERKKKIEEREIEIIKPELFKQIKEQLKTVEGLYP